MGRNDAGAGRDPAMELEAAERRGAADLRLVMAEVRAAGVTTLAGIARALAARGVPIPSSRGAWSPATVLRLDRTAPVREAA